MLKKLTLLFVSVVLTVAYGYSQSGLGSLKGVVSDLDTKKPVAYAQVVIRQNGTIKGGANTDEDGKFQISSITPGSYDVQVRNEIEGYQPQELQGVIVSSDKITFLDDLAIGIPKDILLADEVVVVAYIKGFEISKLADLARDLREQRIA